MSTVVSDAALQERCIDTIRFLAVDGVQKANSGHPGMPMGAAAVAYTLFTRHLRYDPADPHWPNRDRFVLSAGHASMLLYSMLHLTGYDLQHGRPQGVPPVGQPHAGSPGVRAHGRRRDDHRPARPGRRQRRRHGRGRALPRGHLRRRRRRPLHLRARRRRLHDGGHQQRGRLVRRPPAARQAHPAVRRQPHHHRRLDRPRLHRGRGQALRGLRLARAARRRRQRRRRHRRRHHGRQGRDRQAVDDRRAHAHRLRLAQQAGQGRGPWRPARRRRGQADQGSLRLAGSTPSSSCPTTCARPSSPRGKQAAERARRVDEEVRGVARGRRRPRRSRGTTPGRARCPRAGTPTCPSSRPRTRSPPAPPPARSSTPWRRTSRRSWAAPPTSRRPTTP